jgi:histidine phosphotransferase ChpT
MVDDEQTLCALIGSRICHDLINPIGAIGNGMELLTMAGQSDLPEIGLIAESLASASARIRFFRIAYGLAPPDSVVDRSEIAQVIDDSFRAGRLTVVWTPAGAQRRTEVKLAFLCLQCIETAMPRGGDVIVSHDGASWTIVAKSARLQLDDRLWLPLVTPDAPLSLNSSEVHFGILRQLIRGRSPALTVESEEGCLTLRF